MAPNTSPSINDGGEIAFQANTGHLWTLGNGGHGDTGLAMCPVPARASTTSVARSRSRPTPAMSIQPELVGSGDSGVQMRPGPSPSLNNIDQVAVQNAHGFLQEWGPRAASAVPVPPGHGEGYQPEPQ